MAAARRASLTGTIGCTTQSRGSSAQPSTVATGSRPQIERRPVTLKTPSRASVSSGITRPSCWTGSRRSASTCSVEGTGGRSWAEAETPASERDAGDHGRPARSDAGR